MKPGPWSYLGQVFAALDRQLWKSADDRPSLARVVMTFQRTKPLTASPHAEPVPAPANDLQ